MMDLKVQTTKDYMEFICLICKQFLKDPLTCSECLDANFCCSCSQKVFNNNPQCPSCKTTWSDKSLKKNPHFLKLYNAMEIKCSNEGCEWTGKIPHFFQHKEECQKNSISCAFEKFGCGWTGFLANMQAHLEICNYKSFNKFFEKYEEEMTNLNKKCEKTENESQELKNALVKSKADLHSIELQYTDLKKHITEVEQKEANTIIVLQKDNNELKSELDKTQADFQKKAASDLELQNSLKIQIEELKNELSQTKAKFHGLNIRIIQIDKKNKNFLLKYSLREGNIFSMAPNPNYLEEIFPDFSEIKPLYQASINGFGASSFHQYCINKGPTLVLVQSKNNFYFGAYSSSPWDRSNTWKSAPGSFLFSFNHKSKHEILQKEGSAIYCNSEWGPIFGDGHDVCLSSHCNRYKNSYSNLGSTYSSPYEFGSNESKSYLAGSYYFVVEDYEVYAIII